MHSSGKQTKFAPDSRAVAMAAEGLTPEGIMTPQAFANSLRVLLAIGGSTNALIHMTAVAGRLGITAVPLYLLAGLMLGEGGFVQLDVSESFISLTAEIGVLLLLFALGLEYSDVELREGLRTAIAGLLEGGITPEQVARVRGSYTGKALAAELRTRRRGRKKKG